jgi:Rieske Fe-S protein
MDEREVQTAGSACTRRDVLGAGLGIGVGLAATEASAATADASKAPPQPGDRLTFFSGAKKGQPIKVDDLKLGGPQVMATAVDAATGTPKTGRLSQALVIRLDPATLDEETRKGAAEGVVAYSSVCTHQGCAVSQWKSDANTLYCVCHGSQFDPKQGAKVVGGPAQRRLAILPVKVEDGVIVVAGEFSGRVGFK